MGRTRLFLSSQSGTNLNMVLSAVSECFHLLVIQNYAKVKDGPRDLPLLY